MARRNAFHGRAPMHRGLIREVRGRASAANQKSGGSTTAQPTDWHGLIQRSVYATGHRPTALAMGGLNPCGTPATKPPRAALRPRPPLTASRPLTILHHYPKLGVRSRRSGHDRYAEPPKSRPSRPPGALQSPRLIAFDSGSVQPILGAMVPKMLFVGRLRQFDTGVAHDR